MPRSSTIGSWYAIFVPSGDHATCATRVGSPSKTTRLRAPSAPTVSIRLPPSPPPTRNQISPLAFDPTSAPLVPVAAARSDPPTVSAASPIPAPPITSATAATTARRHEVVGGVSERGSRVSMSDQRSGLPVRDNDRKRSSRSGIVIPQELSEPAPSAHEVHPNRRLGRSDHPRDLLRGVARRIVEHDRAALLIASRTWKNLMTSYQPSASTSSCSAPAAGRRNCGIRGSHPALSGF